MMTPRLTYFKFLIIFPLFLISSCTSDDDSVQNQETHLQGGWNLMKTERFIYLNDKFDYIVDSVYIQEHKLIFNTNQKVTYDNPNFTEAILGNWTLNNNILITDLQVNLPSTLGYNVIYFFPENEVININETELILETPMSTESTHYPSGDRTKHYTKSYFEK